MLKVGIVGCGAIGSSLARYIVKSLKGKASLVRVFDRDAARARLLLRLLPGRGIRSAKTLDELVAVSDLVVECAHADAARGICRRALSQGKDVMVLSAGGIVDSFAGLRRLALRRRARLYVPSGALAGIDALKAVRIAGITKVTLTTRKHPRSLQGVAYLREKGIRLDRLRKERVVFSGPVRRAVRHFPQNINVAAILSLAGGAPDKTRITIIASPSIKRTMHEVSITSASGTVTTLTVNELHPDNPKTSYLAVLSASSMLHNLVDSVTLGR